MPLPAIAVVLALLEIPYPYIDPVAIDLPGPIDLRWYGIGYLIAFGVGYLVLRKLARDDFLRLDPDAVGDLITALIIGTIAGGRLGYLLFYSDLGELAENPLSIFQIWEGGLSFHGGLVGVLLAAAWFIRKHRVTFLNLGDSLALGVVFGIFAVRIANFINGELYGRFASSDVPWAMRFPTDPRALELLDARGLPMRARELAIERAYDSGLWQSIMDRVPLRHPSQLYEAATEGLLLGLILWTIYWWARRTGRRLPDGTLGGVFLVGYGAFRMFIELFRQPDPQFRNAGDPLGTVLGPLTMGQTLSSVMVISGLVLIVWAWQRANPRSPHVAR